MMLQDETYAAFHCEEIQEIIGRKPAWILRWGVSIIIVIVVALSFGCYLIKYPETVTATITLTSENPPADLTAKTSGLLDSVFVKNGERVSRGQVIAVIASAARMNDILLIESLLKDDDDRLWSSLGQKEHIIHNLSNLKLGDIQETWIEYLTIYSDYQDYTDIDQMGQKKKLLDDQVRSAKEYYHRLEIQRRTLVEDLSYERKEVYRDSILLSSKMISQSEYESALKVFLAKENSLAGFDATMANASLSRLQIEQQILELDVQRISKETEYKRRIEQAANDMLGKIALWKEQFTIMAPYDGVVSLQNVWGKGQRVVAGDIISSMAPENGVTVIGKLKASSSGFGKVKVGQTVNIKLSGFPYLEFGIIKGTVKSISSIPVKSQEGIYYTVDVVFPEGLISTYCQNIPFVQDMDGVAEIVTDDIRLAEQIIRPLLSLFRNH